MDTLTIVTTLVIVSAAISYLNERIFKLPGTIGVAAISVVVSILILLAGKTDIGLANLIKNLAEDINFSKVLLDVMLGFLLFAGALRFDYQELKAQRWPVFLLSTLGVVVSAVVFGGLLFWTTGLLGVGIPLIYCLLFGTLISPTDPIAVAAILKNSRIPPRLNTIIAGESMFNDGVGLVLFVVVLNITRQADDFSWADTLGLLGEEVLGGIAIGAALGYLGYRLIRSIRDLQTIFLISVALVLGISVVASLLRASIPLAAVTAGLIIGNQTLDEKHASDKFLEKIWQLVDEVLNTILFVLIGLQLVSMPFLSEYWLTGLVSIGLILIARAVSLLPPAILLLQRVSVGNMTILTWAGLRGGISVAMALTLPASDYREIILSSCYFVVIFSIIVQGLTLDKVVANTVGNSEERAKA